MRFLDNTLPDHTGLRSAIDASYRMDEDAAVDALLPLAAVSADMATKVHARARSLVEGVRATRRSFGGIDAFLQEYGLSTKEGVALMCLAEALLRIPDAGTADKLIADKLGGADWAKHMGKGEGLFVNASTWGLMLTGRVVMLDPRDVRQPGAFFGRLVKTVGEPVIREAMKQAMRILGRQFVMGRTIDEALSRAEPAERKGYRYSFDMLGEAARTHADAARYLQSYRDAIGTIGRRAAGRGVIAGPGISVKLSALHPRFEPLKRSDCIPPLVEAVRALALQARDGGIGLCLDSEEADRLDLLLDVFDAVFADPALGGWDGLGIAVQTYQKRAVAELDWLAHLSATHGRRILVRLVKGAYWDSEIKRAQEQGLADYPVFTRKASTDVSYLACTRKVVAQPDRFYPQFATHNAHTVAFALEHARGGAGFEFQRLHGMGEPLYDQLVGPDVPVRVYAPVGGHEELLAYLVRRLLENGANTSFVNRLQDDQVPVDDVIADPVARVAALARRRHPRIPVPRDLFRPERANSEGLDLSDTVAVADALSAMQGADVGNWTAGPVIAGATAERAARPVFNPADRERVVGHVMDATPDDADHALRVASAAWRDWDAMGGEARAAVLRRAADLYESHSAALMALAVREAGKTLTDAVAELREAVDFCRYYAARAAETLAAPQAMPGPTGEDNSLTLRGRGVFVCVSPWNFPLAIFTGQVAAALLAGNAVIAKPAEQTPLIAAYAVRLLHEAGVPPEVLHLLPGDGPTIGGRLVADPRVAGVAFTGSTETARIINRALASRDGPIVPLIAETGGQNAMIVDTTALPEQVVVDVIQSAFFSAGQRCSALRVLFVQEEIADRLLAMLAGAAEALKIGDPAAVDTDIGPVIDSEAHAMLSAHAERMQRQGRDILDLRLHPSCDAGWFFAPRAYQIDSLDRLEREVFGPILHVIRYRESRLPAVLDAVDATGYGLTLGIHSRNEQTAAEIYERLGVGNTYVNRNMVGAVVGVQPFGGRGLSGTGPKAGGPHYLMRYGTERTLTVNTTASGGNAALVSLTDEEPAAAE